MLLVQVLDNSLIPIVFFLMVKPTNNMKFSTTVIHGLLAPLENFFLIHHATSVAPQISSERTEYTAIDTDIRRVQVGVDVVVANIPVDSFPDDIGQFPEVIHRYLRVIHQDPVIG